MAHEIICIGRNNASEQLQAAPDGSTM